jgi:hypothetical protein
MVLDIECVTLVVCNRRMRECCSFPLAKNHGLLNLSLGGFYCISAEIGDEKFANGGGFSFRDFLAWLFLIY